MLVWRKEVYDLTSFICSMPDIVERRFASMVGKYLSADHRRIRRHTLIMISLIHVRIISTSKIDVATDKAYLMGARLYWGKSTGGRTRGGH
jgi:hypothetical protein